MRRLLFIKLESFFDEVVDGLLRESQSFRTEVIPKEIESLLDTPHSGLVGVLLRSINQSTSGRARSSFIGEPLPLYDYALSLSKSFFQGPEILIKQAICHRGSDLSDCPSQKAFQ